MCVSTIFWWLTPIPVPVQSSITRSRSGGVPVRPSASGSQPRIRLAAKLLARNGPIFGQGNDPLSTAPDSMTRTSTPAAAFSASRSTIDW